MKRILSLTITILVLCTSHTLMAQDKMTAREIVDNSYETTKLAGAEATSTMTIMDSKGRERVRKIAMVTKLFDGGETEKKLVRFLAPADVKGTGLLTFDYEVEDDDMWLYMPALRKTRRIVSSEKAKSFMGSEFSYADMTPPNLDDFGYNILSEIEVNGTLCWEIEIIPNDEDIADENGFSKKISYIGKEDFVIRKAVYYDLDETLLKELTVHEFRLLDPENMKYRPVNMEMVNIQNDRKSFLVVNNIQFNPDVKDEYFTTRYLERE
ncbi:RND transporter [candidate division LCP-89 bacterium B3_LCP]|uniref:RND transporter n=1 Tax=candidate division LCP-89 bacterium B3_LCP TaxID=2012998 RepID=A0A532UVX7_UNCL8|nr:MAG: RND transporter [candidate division LCP-89 bacterium B3_LCP]